jgi:hypothetical protein
LEQAHGSQFVATVAEFLQPRLLHVHFENVRGVRWYWIGLGSFCEWFRRLD